MGSSFEDLVAEGVIGEVLARLQSGKEADVYVVRYGAKVCAAKVYKDRATRSFKNNADYLEGRTVRNTRSQRAMGRKSRFGQTVAEDAWKASEADALYKLHAAGVRVPTPVMFLDGVLLMELVLDPNGGAAPRLIDIQLTERDANLAYHDMLRQLVRMLSCDLIHGDLSPYNVLWGPGGPTIIDFPQTISAAHNSNAERFFLRDAMTILGHFASIDRSLNARSSDPGEIWRAYRTRELTPEFVPTGRRFVPRAPIGAPRHDRPRMDGPRGERPGHEGPRPGGPRHEGPPRGGPRPEGPRLHDGQRREGPRPHDGQRREGGPRQDGPRSEGGGHDGPRADRAQQGPRPGRSRPHDGQRREADGSRHEGPRHPPQGERRGGPPGRGPSHGAPRVPHHDSDARRPNPGRRPVPAPEVIVRRSTRPEEPPAGVAPQGASPDLPAGPPSSRRRRS